jgi:hypothetical protein
MKTQGKTPKAPAVPPTVREILQDVPSHVGQIAAKNIANTPTTGWAGVKGSNPKGKVARVAGAGHNNGL